MDNKSHSFLVDWTVNFLKNMDLLAKKIEKIEVGKDGFDLHIKYKDRDQHIAVVPRIEDISNLIQKINNKAYVTIVTLNSKDNFNMVVKNWSKWVGFKFLNIMFVNPFSETDKKWIIFPHTHQKISDQSSLETGLKSMFSMVEQIDEEGLAAKLKS